MDVSAVVAIRKISERREGKLEGKQKWKLEDEWVKPVRSKSKKEYFYNDRDGKPLVKVLRIDYGNGKKKFYQKYWDGIKWVDGNPDEIKKLIPIYRYVEVREAIEQNYLIFVVEGEKLVDLLWELGIPATTTIGGSGKFFSYGNYIEDFDGGRFVLVPDRDAVGVNHVGEIAELLSDCVEGYYLAGTQGLWQNPQGAMDIGDDIGDYAYTTEQILDRIISPEKYRNIIAQLDLSDPDLAEDLKHSIELKNGKAPDVFGGELGKLLSIAASNFNIPVEIMTFCLLPILGSQIDSRTELLINPGTDYRVPAVRWCGLVGDTGSKKSPILGLLTKALSAQQNEQSRSSVVSNLSTDNLDRNISHDDGFTSVSTFVGTGANNSKPLINNDLVHNSEQNVGFNTDSFKPIQDKDSSHSVSIVSTIHSNKNLKVGDRVKPSNSFHERGLDLGTVESIERDLYSVVWNSDRVIRRYTRDELEVA